MRVHRIGLLSLILLGIQILGFVCADGCRNKAFCENGEGRHKIVVEKMRKVVDILGEDDPVFLEPRVAASLLAQESGVVAMSSLAEIKVPKEVIIRAMKWIKLTIREDWQIGGLDRRLVGVKDFQNWVKTDDYGNVISRCVGDYLIAEYQLGDYMIVLIENGVRLSIFVELPEVEDLSNGSESLVKKYVAKFLKVSTERARRQSLKLVKKGDVVFGTMGGGDVGKRGYINSIDEEGMIVDEKMWWEVVSVSTDGSFFFMSIRESEGERVNPQARPGLPDRF